MENIIQDIMLEAWKDSSFQYNYDNGDEFRDLDTPNETEDEYDYLEGGDNLMNK
jgi:hypothetical protein